MSCDSELQELMVQVDRVVEERRSEWREALRITENKLQSTIQENYSLRSIIDDKNIEIGNLKTEMKTRDSIPSMSDYDQEMLQLRYELAQIKKNYEKNHHKYSKKSKDIEKEKEDLLLEKNELLKQINDLKTQQRLWYQDSNKYKIDFEELEKKKNDAITDRCLLNEQLNLLKVNFTQQLDTFSKSEQTYKNNIKELENKLEDSKKCLQKEIEDNRNKLCELMQHTKRTVEEKQQMINDNESAKRMIIRLEQELSKFRSESKVKDKTIYKMEQMIKMSEKAIHEKNEVIKALQINSSTKDHSVYISKVENELSECKTNIKLLKKNEKSLQSEILTLNTKLKDAQQWIENEQKSQKVSEMNISNVSKLEEERSLLKKQIEILEDMINKRTVEVNNTKSLFESVTLENESLKQCFNHDLISTKKNGENVSSSEEFTSRMEKESNQNYNQMTIRNVDKERNELLQFCQDKDMIIQRLQMENRILQEFITKLNFGLTEDMSYMPQDVPYNVYDTVSDVFQPLKETFVDDNVGASSDYNKSTHFIETTLKPNPFESHPSKISSQSYQDHDNVICRSSEEFLSIMSQKEDVLSKESAKGSYLAVYPTLAAAKYFIDEREKSKQFEEVIDHQMNQFRLDSEKKYNMKNV